MDNIFDEYKKKQGGGQQQTPQSTPPPVKPAQPPAGQSIFAGRQSGQQQPPPLSQSTPPPTPQSSVFGAQQRSTPPPTATFQKKNFGFDPGAVEGTMHPALAMLLTLVTVNIFWVFWLYRTVKRVNRIAPQATGLTPGKAVGFLFIPLFGPFWLLYVIFSLPRAILRAGGKNVGAVPVVASLCFLLGVLWPYGFFMPKLLFIVLWIVACEMLILAFIGYCQSALNAALCVAAGAEHSDAERGFYLMGGGAMTAVAAALLVFFAFVHKDADAQMQVARDTLQNGDFDVAAKQLASIDLPEAKFDLACLYKNGLGVTQDTQQAVKLMTDASDAGSPLAQTMLGLWYANGDGVTADPAKAAQLYKQAAAKDPNATVLLAMAYATGSGVEESPVKAYEWYTVAEKQGNSYAAEQKQEMSVLLDDQERFNAEQAAQSDYAGFTQGGGK